MPVPNRQLRLCKGCKLLIDSTMMIAPNEENGEEMYWCKGIKKNLDPWRNLERFEKAEIPSNCSRMLEYIVLCQKD